MAKIRDSRTKILVADGYLRLAQYEQLAILLTKAHSIGIRNENNLKQIVFLMVYIYAQVKSWLVVDLEWINTSLIY